MQSSTLPIKENHSILVLNTDKGKNVGRLNVKYASGEELKYESELFVVTESMDRDAMLAQLVDDYKMQLKETGISSY